MIQLYLTPLSDRTTDTATDQIRSRVQQAGLIDNAGTATENIATENVDYQKVGRIQDGPTLSSKLAAELNSLSRSGYTKLPLFDAADGQESSEAGYYEITRINVPQTQEGRDDVYQYDARLADAGTRENSRRAVRTNLGNVDTIASSTSTAVVIGVPNAATNVQWYDEADGTEDAAPDATVEAEFGTVAQYDPDAATFADPTLTYDLPYADDGPIDVRVYDSRNRIKSASTASGNEVNTWIHAYDTAYQFTGAAVIDTGVFRLILGGDLQAAFPTDEVRTVEAGTTDTISAGTTETDGALVVEDTGTFIVEDTATHILTGDAPDLRDDFAAARWDDTNEVWRSVMLDTGTAWELAEWSLTRVRPARVELSTRWSDGTDSQRLRLTLQRGQDNILITIPDNETSAPQALIDILDPITRDTSRTAAAVQGLIDRDEVT